jgi:hypothetical protein
MAMSVRRALICGMKATGVFQVSLEQLPSDDDFLGRMRVRKIFAGDLEGTGLAQMLSVGTAVEGSAAYVAIDFIDAVLDGRKGTFVLRHSGVMAQGEGTLSVDVVPDSGTGELTGLSGELNIEVADGEHRYVFDYELRTPLVSK